MIAARLRLEEFQTEESRADPVKFTELDLEEARLAAYESGYQTGLDDAARAQMDDQTRINIGLADSLHSLSFTYHEARSHVLRALEPLLQDMLMQLLPKLAMDALPGMISDILMPMAAEVAEAPVTLQINPAHRSAVEPVFANPGFPLQIADDVSLEEGQALLRFDRGEYRIDLAGAIEEIRTAVNSFYTLQTEARRHG